MRDKLKHIVNTKRKKVSTHLISDAVVDIKEKWEYDRVNEEYGKSIVDIVNSQHLTKEEVGGFLKCMDFTNETYLAMHNVTILDEKDKFWAQLYVCVLLEIEYRIDNGLLDSEDYNNMYV